MMSPVKSKSDFVRRYKRGEFGNRAPTWNNVGDFLDFYRYEWPPEEQLFHLRNREAGGSTLYNCSFETIKNAHLSSDRNWYVSAMAPDQHLTLQGEIKRGTLGLELRYSQVKLPMRDALKKEEHTVSGLRSKLLVASHMNPLSYDWLQELLDNYPNHIIEFASFSVEWGNLPGYNTVFWEVRPDRSAGSNLSPFTEVY